MTVSRLKKLMWERHRNPWSGWTRVAIGFALLPAVWFQSVPAILLVIVAAMTNPFWLPPPNRSDAFMTRIVDGERLWLARAGLYEKILMLWLPILPAGALFWALWTNHPGWSLFFTILAYGQKLVFVLWCAELAEAEEDTRP